MRVKWRNSTVYLFILTMQVLSGCSQFPGSTQNQTLQYPESMGILPLVDGPKIFEETHRLLQKATQEIDYEMYEIGNPSIFDDLLAAKTRGVAVYVITDPSVPESLKTAKRLEAAGIPVHLLKLSHAIDHVKLLVVDHNQSLIGGMNHGSKSFKNHDADVLISGETSKELENFFQEDWNRTHSGNIKRSKTYANTDSQQLIRPLRDAEIGQALLSELQAAKSNIRIEMFTLTSRDVLKILVQKHQAGVKVEVIVDPNQNFNEPAITLLTTMGIRVKGYPAAGYLMHMKMGIIDNQILFLGSANWTHAGLDGANHEMDIQIVNPSIANSFIRMFDQDYQKSNQL